MSSSGCAPGSSMLNRLLRGMHSMPSTGMPANSEESTSDTDSPTYESMIQRLPPELLERILGCMSFEDVAQTRLVSQRFNRTCQSILNQGFCKVDRLHTASTKWVKSHLPRRESERRSHPLARHCDILSGIETRLSLLSMTYTKYIETGAASFIPGKVLDEVVRILNLVQVSAKATLDGCSSNLPRAHELLQELRDISSMAMEHFDEKIVPIIRYRAQQQQQQLQPQQSSPNQSTPNRPMSIFREFLGNHGNSLPGSSSGPSLAVSKTDICFHSSNAQHFAEVASAASSSSTSLPPQVPLSEFNQLKKKFSTMKRKFDEVQKLCEDTISQQTSQIQGQNHIIQMQNQRVSKLERRLDRLAKKFLDCNAKVEDILRCGQTGIKLKRKSDDVALLSGDESETSMTPSPKDNNDDDCVETNDDEDEDSDDLYEEEDCGAVEISEAKDYHSLKMAESKNTNVQSSSSCSASTSNATRQSPIKLRLRQTSGGARKRVAIRVDPRDAVDAVPASPAEADESSQKSKGKSNKGRKGKGASSSLTSTTTQGVKRRKEERVESGGSQRKRLKH